MGSIDDADLLGASGTSRVIGQVRAPSTIGTFLCSFRHRQGLQLEKLHRLLLA